MPMFDLVSNNFAYNLYLTERNAVSEFDNRGLEIDS